MYAIKTRKLLIWTSAKGFNDQLENNRGVGVWICTPDPSAAAQHWERCLHTRVTQIVVHVVTSATSVLNTYSNQHVWMGIGFPKINIFYSTHPSQLRKFNPQPFSFWTITSWGRRALLWTDPRQCQWHIRTRFMFIVGNALKVFEYQPKIIAELQPFLALCPTPQVGGVYSWLFRHESRAGQECGGIWSWEERESTSECLGPFWTNCHQSWTILYRASPIKQYQPTASDSAHHLLNKTQTCKWIN